VPQFIARRAGRQMKSHHEEIRREVEQRRFEVNTNLLRIYNYYRVFVGLALLAVFMTSLMGSRLGGLSPTAFLWSTLAYIAINLATAVAVQFLPRRFIQGQTTGAVLVVFDILALTWLTYLSGGVASGLGLLILVSVSTGSIIVTSRATAVLAATASIAVLYEEFYLSLTAPALHDDYFQAGVLGVFYFAFSLSIHHLARRIREDDLRAMTQAAELADLERLNRQIVQSMRTGIIVVDSNNRARMMNQSATALLGLAGDEELTRLPEPLEERLEDWRADSRLRAPPFQVEADTPEVRANFSAVRAGGDVTIFLEDTSELQQQAQQLKLAGLGRLSANIAHEIRNPLGAISHAAQLLRESQNLDEGETRLTQIIHNHCQRMNGVIENVLEMSRRSPSAPVRLRLKDLIEEFADSFREAVNDAIIDIDVMPEDTEIRVDRSQMSQVLTNLAGNGIRYSYEATGKPFVRLEGGIDPRTDRPYLNVIDRGPGVPNDQVANLFEAFHTTERAGTGLGLYISKELCETNQARLSYSRHADGGSCFRIAFAHPDRITA
jgi:two-component system sensor histidine kinase PilS (NtrC family)